MSDIRCDLSVHPLIAKLNPKPGDQRRYVTILGYVGPAPKKGIISFYPSLDLRSYLEISVTDILCTEPADSGRPLGPTRLTVDAAADMVHVDPSRSRISIGFVSGSIADANLDSAAAGAAATPPASAEIDLPVDACEPARIAPRPRPTSRCNRNGACLSAPINH